MATLTPPTILAWIGRLSAIIEHCNMVVGLDDVPDPIWQANRNSRTQAIVMRDELLELVVSPVEVS